MIQADIKLCFAPSWDLINPSREFFMSFFTIALRDSVIAGQVGLAAHELMENAVKYSTTDEASASVQVVTGGPITICLENEARPEHLPSLLASIQAVNEAADPLRYYRQLMEQSLTIGDGKSGLGLARIRCEAEMSLSCEVNGNRVKVKATRLSY